MKPISADSHVVEGRDVFTGLADRFGDQAPRVMNVGDQVDAIVIPANGMRGVSVARMGMAATRMARNEPLNRKPGHKPDVAHMKDPELVALFNKGYAGMRKGLVDGAHRYEDQDVDGLAAEFLYPGFFGMFGLSNTALLVALQKNYNDWLNDYSTASDGRLFGLAAIPVQDPEAATEEIDRVIAMGFKGGCIPCTSPADRYTPMASPTTPRHRARCSGPSSSSCAAVSANDIRTSRSWSPSSTRAGSPTGSTASTRVCSGNGATWTSPSPAPRLAKSGCASSTLPSRMTARRSPRVI